MTSEATACPAKTAAMRVTAPSRGALTIEPKT
jgi:hypothetical protein